MSTDGSTTVVEKHGTHFLTMFDRDYLGSFDLQGRDVTVTISKVVGGQLTAQGGRKSKKPICYFDGKEKGLICNKTNSKTIASMYGNYVEAWVGKRITLYVSTTNNPDGSGSVECIRIRPTVPGAVKTAREDTPQI